MTEVGVTKLGHIFGGDYDPILGRFPRCCMSHMSTCYARALKTKFFHKTFRLTYT